MKISKTVVLAIVVAFCASPVFAAEDDSKAFGQFQEIVQGIDQRSFDMVKKFLDQTDLTNRVYGHNAVDDNVRASFRSQFWEIIESGFMQGLPPEESKVHAELVQFTFTDGVGRACIRFSLPGYKYKFHVFEVRHDKRGRLKVVDWFDTSIGHLFTAQISNELITIMPTKESTRRLLSIPNPTDIELFQATEILKATRDAQPSRFFEIYDQFEDRLKREPLIAKRAVAMAYQVQDGDRFLGALEIFAAVYSEDPQLALMTADYYLAIQDYVSSFESLRRFHQNFAVKEGALPAKLSALALAIGEPEEAEKFAVEATINEPTLELAWWSLLRARTSANNHAGAIEALTHLEDDFGHRLDESKLRRDKFRAFATLAASQEFKDWRGGRP